MMLDISNLCVAYGQSQVIKGISLTVNKGETVAVMGRNGMGKTTLMKSIIGLLGAQSGSINVGGVDVTKYQPWDRVKRGVAFVPQGRQIFSLMSVEENLKTGLETVRPRKIDESIYETFPVLKEMRKRKGGNLSGGQQQQLAIARALSSKPKVLLLDEPAEGIQPSIVKDIARVLNQIKKIHDLTILISEQLLSFAMDVADRILVIEGGRIVHEEQRASVDEATIHKYLSV
jgi:urea transport system ATP-binding protein